MAWRLSVVRGAPAQRFLLARPEQVLGSAEECELRLLDPTVSRRHVRLCVGDRGVTVEDLGARNGCFIDGQRLQGIRPLAGGALLRLGDVELSLSEVDAADAEAATKAVPAAPRVDPARPPTLALSALASFCREALPGLITCLARRERDALPAQLVDALVAQDGIDYAEVLSGAGALLAAAGHAGSALRLQASCATGSVRLGLATEEAAPALQRIADIAADLLCLAQSDAASTGPRAAPAGAMAHAPDPPSRHPGLARIYAQAARVADSDLHVLIEGESGTGKELLARYLHEASGRRAAMVSLNCAALPRDLLDAELFGIEAGVATGVSARPGCFERAHGGTLFLDEIADMAADTQARLLRVLQERRVFRIGGREPRPAEVRVVSASNRSLAELVQRGEFRLDLYHRIQDWCVVLPPLRERGEDILNLAGYFLAQACRRRGIGCAGISRAAADALLAHDWPGNVRELEREMRRIALFVDDGELVDSALLKPEVRGANAGPAGQRLVDQLARAERAIIERCLTSCAGNVAQAAERLGLGKSTLYRRLAELGIERSEGSPRDSG